MTKLLIKFDRNWADEFNVYGFEVWDAKAWADKKAEVLKMDSYSMQFGSNEGWDDEDPADFLSDCTETEITDEEAVILEKLFKGTFGIFPDFECEDWDE